MTFEEFAKADSDKLTEMAKACFDNSQEMAGGAWERRVAKLLEAQFYVIRAAAHVSSHFNSSRTLIFPCHGFLSSS
jgi:hypothetical protein